MSGRWSMRFLQIYCFEGSYFNAFYARHPELINAPFRAQMAGLFEDGFYGTQMVAPYLEPLGYESQVCIANCMPAQHRWAVENGLPGVDSPQLHSARPHFDVGMITHERWPLEIVRAQIESFRPDVLYIAHGDAPFDSGLVRSCSWKPRLVLGWRAASMQDHTDFSAFDCVLSSSECFRERARELGAPATENWVPGFPDHVADAVRFESPKWDLGFTGQWSQWHLQRNGYLLELAGLADEEAERCSLVLFLMRRHEFPPPPQIASRDFGVRFGIDMFRALRAARIQFNSSADLTLGECVNMRVFEAAGVGAFQLAQHHPNLGEYFEIGREVETFDDVHELRDKVRHYLAHPSAREAMAARAQERCLRDHAMSIRARGFDTIVRRLLERPSSVAGPAPESPIRGEPDVGDALREMLQRGDLDGARAGVEEALAREPERPDLLNLSVEIDVAFGDEADALARLTELAERFPDHPGILSNLAVVQWQAGRAQQALALLRRAFALAPRDSEVAENLAALLRAQAQVVSDEAAA